MAEECHKTTRKRRASHHGARRRRISDDQGRGIDHWTGGNTLDQRTGTTHRLSGTVWAITGTTGAVAIEDILARLPKLRKDARANVESVLHELIADKNATIPQICVRTGMALRTISNALATLRGACVLKARGN